MNRTRLPTVCTRTVSFQYLPIKPSDFSSDQNLQSIQQTDVTFVHTSLSIHSLCVLMGKWHGIPNQTSIHRQIQVGSWLYCEPWQNSNFTNVSADHGSPASHHRDQAGNILIIAIEVGKAVSCKDFLSDLQWKFSVKSIEIDVLSICLITCVFTVG